jgi:hypothetical protein
MLRHAPSPSHSLDPFFSFKRQQKNDINSPRYRWNQIPGAASGSTHDLLIFILLVFGLLHSPPIAQHLQQTVVMGLSFQIGNGDSQPHPLDSSSNIQIGIYRLTSPELAPKSSSLPCSSNVIIPIHPQSAFSKSISLKIYKSLRIPRFSDLAIDLFQENVFGSVPHFLMKLLVVNPHPQFIVPHRFGEIGQVPLPPHDSTHFLGRRKSNYLHHDMHFFSLHFLKRKNQILTLWIGSHSLTRSMAQERPTEDSSDVRGDEVDSNEAFAETSQSVTPDVVIRMLDSLNVNEITNESICDQFYPNEVSQQIF